ncbi:M15 family metallopeptidase [Aestuariibacter sp. A3R04]|uniref:M15 family metallopeptidase n=1 Tax=Aestuariibacter sp. A3R04 TaxID=2841571 RepID=UPI001C0967B0|nr:M15 family metallopeptidase [Aestuariibacter sp. A3R04]MBU3022606.1 M15 family metallopeptidase [Aestuariibacter sp. A3R04]
MKCNNAWLGIDNPFLTALASGFELHEAVVEDWLALQQAAQADGIDCQLLSSYRNFHRQLQIWNKKWRGEATLFDKYGVALDYRQLDDNGKIEAILTWSALPGGSRHHWGTDIDVFDKRAVEQCDNGFDLVDAEYRSGGPCYPLAQWLDNNLSRFGFFRPFTEDNNGVSVELWHLSHAKTAADFEQQRNVNALADVIAGADMEGKDAVLSRIDELYHRYVLNEGI